MTDSTSPNTQDGIVDDSRFRVRSRALGDATRYAIYREIARLERPVAVTELTDTFGLNHTTVRQHLAKLRDAGLIVEAREAPSGPGRPRLLYRLTDEAAASWNDEGPYERLSLLLLEVATTGASPVEVGRSAGRRLAAVTRCENDPVALVHAVTAAQGFAPELHTDGESHELVLGHCPLADAVDVNPEIVCALHRGMLEGLASVADGVDFDSLEAVDPRRGECRVHLTRTSFTT